MSTHRIYRYSSIARPLDPSCATNRAVLLLLPLAALAGAAQGWVEGLAAMSAFQQALVAALGAFAAWALARELDPDHNASAFIAMALGFAATLWVESPGILVVFVTLGLVRLVNRSTGLAARSSDSVLMLLLSILVIYIDQSPFFGLVAALAFFLDGSLKEPLRRQVMFGFVAAGATVVYLVDHDLGLAAVALPKSLYGWLALLFLMIFALNALLLKSVESKGDCGDEPLDAARVKGGMAVGLLAALQGVRSPDDAVLIVAVIAGIGMGMAFRRSFRSPGNA